MPISLLFSPYTWLILALAGLGIYASVQTSRLHSCQESVEAKQAQIGVLRGQLAELGERVDAQNRAVAAFQSASDAAKKRASVALANAETAKLAHKATVEDLTARIEKSHQTALTGSNKPAQVEKSCSDALSEIRSQTDGV